MQKKLIALAVAGMFAAPAFAATSNVDVGGYLNMSVDYLDSDNATNGGNVNVSSNASNIFFKGSEDLGGGLKAIWQIQTYFTAGRTGNGDNSFGATLDGVGSGNTFVGLEGGFGKVLLGKHESPYKLVGRKYDFFGNQIGDSRNIIGAAGMDARPNNVIAYGTPNLGGFNALVAYVTNTANNPASITAGTGATGAAVDNSVDAWSANVGYDNGPLSIGLGYQKVNWSEFNPAAEDQTAWRLGASYAFGDFKVAGLYQQDKDVGGVANTDVDVWGLGAAYKLGAMTFKGQYYTGEMDNVVGGDADMWSVGVDYALSKRTTVYGAYAAVDNGSAMAITPFGGGHGDNPGTVAGGDPNGFSIGVVHSF